MNIVTVVVTYNRLVLLKQNIEALKKQTHTPTHIVVIDNCSTDGTAEFLHTVEGIHVIRTTRNTGGAGGFFEGLKAAAALQADWIWLMDDDTIPHDDALEKMLPYTHQPQVGFINSKVVWKDGSQHLMNKVVFAHKEQSKNTSFPNEMQHKIIRNGSFVSMLIRGDMPFKIGLPYREFFIWCDDYEYSYRMFSHGFVGIYAEESVVLHATTENYTPALENITAQHAWKLYYEERNGTFIYRKHKNPIVFFFSQLNKIRLQRRLIKKRHLPKDEEHALLHELTRGLWDGIFFHPKIEWIDTENLTKKNK